MNKEQFQTVKTLVREYMNTLDLDEVKKEFATNGLMTSNTKLQKGDKMNLGLELLPSVLSPINTCEGAGACKYQCLAFSGLGNILKSKSVLSGMELNAPLMTKARRTFLYINDRDWMYECLEMEIRSFASKAKLLGKEAYFRLNVTSDLDWREFTSYLSEYNFYDYTKAWSRSSTPNYKLTFSVSELTTDTMIMEKINKGENLAVVFAFPKGIKRVLPEYYFGAKVIDGDISDDRSNDPQGIIVGLKIKTPMGGINTDSAFYRIVNPEMDMFKMVA